MNLFSNKTTLSDIQHSFCFKPILLLFMTHFFLIELSLPHWISFLIPGESHVLSGFFSVFLFTTASRSLSLCSSFNPTPVLIIASPRLFMLPSVPWPKSSLIALTLCLIPPLVHAPPNLFVSLSSKREMHTVSIWHLQLFRGLPQPWTNLMIDLPSPDLNLENTVLTNALPANYHMLTFLYYHLSLSTFLLTLNNPNAITSNYPAQPRLPSQRVCPDCLSHPACFLFLVLSLSAPKSHNYNYLCTPPAHSLSTTPTFLDYFSSSLE